MSSLAEKDSIKSPGEQLAYRSSLNPKSPGSGTIKAVQIAEPPEGISPLMQGASKDVDDFSLDRSGPRKHRTSIASSRMTGRLPVSQNKASSRGSVENLLDGSPDVTSSSKPNSRPNSLLDTEGLAARISAWIQREKHRRSKRKAKRSHRKKQRSDDEDLPIGDSDSDVSSEGSVALEHLQEILNRTLAVPERPASRRGTITLTKKSSRARLRRPSATASDTELNDVDDLVPTCDVILDNTKVSITEPGVAEELELGGKRPSLSRASSMYQKEAWKSFKYEIVRLTHTLRLRGWRRVPMQMSSKIEVLRLSGALTNAVYEVSPPNELPARTTDTVDGTCSAHPKVKPQKLLLRIYGVGVENLIDREAELQIMRRLRRKNIGPRLLGCFQNGRFEEFLHAKALSAHELHDPTVSTHIAKRMRELHEGMDLLPIEREEGSFVWCSVNRWKKLCEPIVKWLDAQAHQQQGTNLDRPAFVCGTGWQQFADVLQKYHDWLFDQYGGPDKLKEQLVFAHNDTQYGNILRMIPDDDSPLLTPENAHKQLQVIDFEYANANLPGFEFANHFTEWTYNYHDEKVPYHCEETLYPTLEEQRRFIRAYLMHNPKISKAIGESSAHPSGPTTPALGPATASLSTSLISNFMLDSRFPQASKDGPAPTEEEIERDLENEITRLQHETRIWRMACSTFWTMWGIQKAKVPGLPDFGDPTQSAAVAAGPTMNISMSSGTLATVQSPIAEEDHIDSLETKTAPTEVSPNTAELEAEEEAEVEEDEFDYLRYSWERAMLFWGDAVSLGFVKKADLPLDVQKNIKIVEN